MSFLALFFVTLFWVETAKWDKLPSVLANCV